MLGICKEREKQVNEPVHKNANAQTLIDYILKKDEPEEAINLLYDLFSLTELDRHNP